MDYRERFTANLNEIMEARGIQGVQMAKAVGISEAAISNYRTGRKEPTLTSLCMLADYFEISLDVLVGRKEY